MNSLKKNKNYDYRDTHIALSKPEDYDPQFWIPGTMKNLFWEMEREIISNIIRKYIPFPQKALDFACGTGRVLSFIEQYFPETIGIDVSSSMLAVAQKRCQHSRIIDGDLTTDPSLVKDDFDLVTAFRFLLNAQQELRESVLKSIHRIIKSEGILIVNFHLNPYSITGSYLMFRCWLKGTNRSMISVRNAKDLLRSCGFNPLGVYGYGYLLHRREYVRLPNIRGSLEKILARLNMFPSIAMNFIIVAQAR